MRKILMSLLLASLSLMAQAQGRYVIDGTVSNAPEGAVVKLFRNTGNILRPVASDTITDNLFHFEGETTGDGVEPMILLAMYNGMASMVLDVYVRPGSRVKVTGGNMLVYTWDVESDVPEQQTRQKIIAASRKWLDERQLNTLQEDSIRDILRDGGLSDEAKANFQSMLDSIAEAAKTICDSIVLAETKVMAGMPVDSVWLGALADDAFYADYSGNQESMNAVKILYDRLPEQWKNTADGAEIGTIIYPPKEVQEGEAIVDGDLFDVNGNIHHLADFKGKYVLLDFWSIGCSPCMQSIPELKEIAEAYKDTLVVVSLSLDVMEIWRQESVKHGITWYNLNDLQGNSGISACYGVSTIPHYVLVSPSGTMIGKTIGYREGKLKEYVGKYLDGK